MKKLSPTGSGEWPLGNQNVKCENGKGLALETIVSCLRDIRNKLWVLWVGNSIPIVKNFGCTGSSLQFPGSVIVVIGIF